MQPTLLVVDDEPMTRKMLERIFGSKFQVVAHENAQDALDWLLKNPSVSCIITDLNMPQMSGKELLQKVRQNPRLSYLPFVIISGNEGSSIRIECLEAGADDYIEKPFNPQEVKLKIEAVLRRVYDATYYFKRAQISETPIVQKKSENDKLPFWKRLIDILASGMALLLLSPILFFIALAIKLDSKGQIVYKSKRVGTGYRIFELYKFRTMRTDADLLIKDLADLNIYKAIDNEADKVLQKSDSGAMLFSDGQWVCEEEYIRTQKQGATFAKFKNDPRITGIGKLLRNSSLDELPQLWNVLVGDMSLVGNRPLPLYEAEKLTTDKAMARFEAPAGLTGLWQVTKRSKNTKEITAEERIQLDIEYAKHYSPKMDLSIILKTFPALLQSENV